MIRWLHLSDVHECNKEGYHRKAMYEEIVRAVKAREQAPDLVFLTGDLAFAGKEKEYKTFRECFFQPLKAALPDDCPIFMVPGNHDVDRDAATKPRFWVCYEEERKLFQEISEAGARKRREMLLPRLAGYLAFQAAASSWDRDWLSSEQGSACHLVEMGDKKLAIVGINTAWLCQDDQDWGKLTAGRDMVDRALREAEKLGPDLVIVLGHHPIEAMMGETAWSDGNRVRLRLQQANAIYLHGHLHLAGDQRSGDPLESVLAIQAPSAFQAADSKTWRNGIMWGELDLDSASLFVEPLKWNDDFREYKFDTDAGPSRNLTEANTAFRLRLPGHHEDEEAPKWPDGWKIIDPMTLANMSAERPSPEDMSDYFDGSLPNWQMALAEGVQPRRIVEDLTRRYRQHHGGGPLPLVTLVTGAGGEGKSTALLQVVAALLRDDGQSWTCLHREAAAANVSEKLFDGLDKRDGHAWIVALDDAENVGNELVAALKHVRTRTDVHLLLAAREADWRVRGLTPNLWHGVAEFRQVPMPGLDQEDALRIVQGWHAFGEHAMGRLRGTSLEQASKALYGHASEHAAQPGEGVLLGALLFIRQGEELKERVRGFLAPLRGKPGVKGYDLLDIYAMIAAMHGENQLYLTRRVLAFALRCDELLLDSALRILQQEAMLDSGGTYLLTRHRRIAEVACQVLDDEEYDLKKWYPFLARAALQEFRKNYSGNPDIAKWTYDLPKYFVQKGEMYWPTAQDVAKELFELEGKDPRLLVNYSRVLRETNVPGRAMMLLKDKGTAFKSRRGVLYEWSVVAGAIGDDGLNAWLGARSLADGKEPIDAKRCKLSLAGLGRAFEKLYEDENSRQAAFREAQAACGRLGLSLPDPNASDRKFFGEHASVEPDVDPASQDAELELGIIQRAVLLAAYEVEPDNSPDFFEKLIGEPDTYRYRGVLTTIRGEDKVSMATRRAS